MFAEGDIVEIPLPDGRTAIGRILHVSKHFKDAVGFIVFGIKGQVSESVEFDSTMTDPTTMRVLGPLYTHSAAIEHYGWKRIAHAPVSARQQMLTKRRVGGNVYVGDECIGGIAEFCGEDIRPMLAMGMLAVYETIESAFPEG